MLQNIRLGTKLIISFGVLTVLTVIVGLAGVSGITKTNKSLTQVADNRLPSIRDLRTISEDQESILSSERGLTNPGFFADKTRRDKQFKDIDELWQLIDVAWMEYDKLPHDAEEKQLWQTLKDQWPEWKQLHLKVRELAETKAARIDGGEPVNTPAILALDKQILAASLNARVAFHVAEATLEKLQKNVEDDTAAEKRSASAMAQASQRFQIGAIILSLLLSIALGLYFVLNINGIISSLLKESHRLTNSAIEGRLSTRGDINNVNFEFRGIIQGFNETLDAVITPLSTAAHYVQRIAQGDIPPRITESYRGDFNEIKDNLNQCIDAVNFLIQDADRLAQAAARGQLDLRTDISRHNGDFGKVVRGMNTMLDVIETPLKESMVVLKKMSGNDFTIQVNGQYEGDFATFAQAINDVRTRLLSVIDAFVRISEGDLSRLEEAKRVGKRSEHDELVPALVKMMQTQQDIIDNVHAMYQAQKAGDTEAMIDTTQFKGAYRSMTEGINESVQLHINTVLKILNILGQYANGDLSQILERLPGKQAIANEAMDTLRGNLFALEKEIRQVIAAVNNGKLLQRTDPTKFSGSWRNLVEGINEILNPFEKTVGNLKSVVEQVSLSAEQMSQMAENVGKASQEVAGGAQQVAEGAGEQAHSANTAATNMEQLQRAIEEVARGAQVQASGAEQAANAAQQAVDGVRHIAEVAENTLLEAQNTGKVANQGALIVDETVQGMNRVRAVTEESSVKVNILGESSKKIGEIVEAINDIAEQTNLLALNAAIEAARAGEHGKGFAVVADEVRKLAERSAGQTKEIAQLIRGIQEGISEAVTSMAAGSREVEAGVASANKAGKALEEILTAAEKLSAQVQSVAQIAMDVRGNAEVVLKAAENVSSVTEETTAATEQMAASSSEVSRAIEHVAAITEQASSTSEELSAAAEEQNASVEEMTASTHELADLANQVRTELARFQVSTDLQNELTGLRR